MMVCAVLSFLLSKVVEFGGKKYCGDKVLKMFLCSEFWTLENFCASGGAVLRAWEGVA